MAYEPDKVHRTLILHRRVVGGRKVYNLGPDMKIVESDGTTYLEQVPSEGFMDGSRDVYHFDEIEVMDSPAPKTDATANMHELSCRIGDGFAVRNRA